MGPAPEDLAERQGFEPWEELSPLNDLANRRFRPLSHLSAVEFSSKAVYPIPARVSKFAGTVSGRTAAYAWAFFLRRNMNQISTISPTMNHMLLPPRRCCTLSSACSAVGTFSWGASATKKSCASSPV